jgi:hypothetical protein
MPEKKKLFLSHAKISRGFVKYSNISTKFLPLPSVQSNRVIFFRIAWLAM